MINRIIGCKCINKSIIRDCYPKYVVIDGKYIPIVPYPITQDTVIPQEEWIQLKNDLRNGTAKPLKETDHLT